MLRVLIPRIEKDSPAVRRGGESECERNYNGIFPSVRMLRGQDNSVPVSRSRQIWFATS